MKAQKVDDVKFAIEQDHADLKFNLIQKKGGLYLSLSNLFFKSENKWYEIPVSKLEKIEVLQKDPPQLEFSIPSMKITVKGEYAEKLLALRHLLLPYIKGERELRDPMIAILKISALGINKKEAISDLLGLDMDDIQDYIDEAIEYGLMDDGKVTEKGRELLNKEDDFLNTLEV